MEKYFGQDVQLLYKNFDKNIFYRDSDIAQKIKSNNKIIFERFRNICLNEKLPFVFHSSYYRYCKNKNAVNITTVHDFIYEYFRHDLKSKLHKTQKKNAIKNSHGVICNSENTKKDLLIFCPDYKGMIKVIYSGLSEDYYCLDIPRKKNVIFIGARTGYKNFDYSLELIKKFPELKLQIVGGGELTEKEKMLLKNKIPNSYEYYCNLSNKELNLMYNEAKYLLYPSLYEGFGVPVVEAQAAGCPVVCCNVSSLPEVAGDAALYITGKNIEEDLGLISSLDNIKVYTTYAKKGVDNCKKFSWKKCAEETNNFYKEVYNSVYTEG